MTEPLFDFDGTAYHPSRFTRSPWSPEMLHGGAAGALLVGAIEQHQTGDIAMQVVRVTADIVRPVPMAPLAIETTTVRPGRRVSVVEGLLRAGDDVCVRMTALRLRDADVAIPADTPQPTSAMPAPLPGDSGEPNIEWPFEAFHTHGCEVRWARGRWLEPGPAFVWIRLRHPVLADEAPSPMQRMVAASDSANGVSSVLPFENWLFVNPDLSVHLYRVPHGEWIGLDAVTLLADRGAGMSSTTLYDVQGRIGATAQSLLVEPR